MAAPKLPTKLTPEGLTYLRSVLEGVLEGPNGRVKVNPYFRDLINGVYHALSGGTVNVNIVTPGDPNQVKVYQRIEKASLKSSNQVNEQHVHPIRVDI